MADFASKALSTQKNKQYANNYLPITLLQQKHFDTLPTFVSEIRLDILNLSKKQIIVIRNPSAIRRAGAHTCAENVHVQC